MSSLQNGKTCFTVYVRRSDLNQSYKNEVKLSENSIVFYIDLYFQFFSCLKTKLLIVQHLQGHELK